jgi:hypothetical protein
MNSIDQFKDSYTYFYNQYKDYKDKLSKYEVGTSKYDFTMESIKPIEKKLKEGFDGGGEYQCPLYHDKCKFICYDLKEQLEHEHDCLEFNRPPPIEVEFKNTLYKCKDCGWETWDGKGGKTVVGLYHYNRHIKGGCNKKKKENSPAKVKKRLRDSISLMSHDQILLITKFCEENNINI